MSVSGPITGPGDFNQALADLVEEAERGGMDRATIATLLAQEVTVFGSQMMQENVGIEFAAGKAIQGMGLAIRDLASRL